MNELNQYNLLAVLLDPSPALHHLIHSLLDVGRVKVVLLNQLGAVALQGVKFFVLGKYQFLEGIMFLHLQKIKTSPSLGEAAAVWSALGLQERNHWLTKNLKNLSLGIIKKMKQRRIPSAT